MPAAKPDKPCLRCGRPFTWRAKWARDWESVRYCSERCRRTRVTPTDAAAEQAVLELLAARAPESSICPSEVARRIAPDDWRPLMRAVRTVAARLSASGAVRVTQGPREVHALDAKGPIRLRRGARFGER